MTPLFLDGRAGPLFAIYHAPPSGNRERGRLLYVPPFAEEMNRSRRMAALQARSLAAMGVGVLLLDLFGTGDSGGEFREARWQSWLDDISTAVDWLEQRGAGPLGLWGLRAGSLLTSAAVMNQPNRFKYLVLWHPTPDGKTLLSQFLRVRVAAARLRGDASETANSLRAEWTAGRNVEIAGYEVPADLARALGDLKMENLVPHPEIQIHWLEVATDTGGRLTPAGERVVESWRAKGIGVIATSVAGEQFWAIEESQPAENLLSKTARAVESCLP